MGGAGWGGMEMQDAEIGTELREGEKRGGEGRGDRDNERADCSSGERDR